jgi:RES domain-containing protein
VTRPEDWDLDAFIDACPIGAWEGTAWRAHKRRYDGTDPGGSLRFSGRYNRGLDQFPEAEIWPALYLALAAEISLGEIMRHLTPELLPVLNDYRITELSVSLSAAIDCRDLSSAGLLTDALLHDNDYGASQSLAAAAISHGAEGILVPSATRLGDNLVIFTAQLRADSRLAVVASRDPRLFVPRA